jgi:hypothetical protein
MQNESVERNRVSWKKRRVRKRVGKVVKIKREKRRIRRGETNLNLNWSMLLVPMRMRMVSTNMHGVVIVPPNYFVGKNVKFV